MQTTAELPVILLTRPDPGGARFAGDLRARFGPGSRIVTSPVLRIEPCGAAPDLAGVACLLFTSQHGVARFAELSARRDLPGYAVGDATARVARAAGLRVTACEGDAASMLARIAADDEKGPFLHIRGEHAATALAEALRARGLPAREAVLYRQEAVPLSDEALAVLEGPAPVVLPLFSPRSAEVLFAGCAPRAPLCVVAISQAVAERVPEEHSGRVIVAKRPDGAAMLDAMAQALRVEGAKPAQ